MGKKNFSFASLKELAKEKPYLIIALLIVLLLGISPYFKFLPASAINKTISINLIYWNESEFDTNNDGIENLTGIIDLSIANTRFNWEVNYSNLGTRWEIYDSDRNISTIICYGAVNTCNFFNLEPLRERWNETLYLVYENYAGFNNTVSAQVVYVDYSFEINNPYTEIYNSEWQILPAIFINITETINDTLILNETLNLTNTTGNISLELNLSINITQNLLYIINISDGLLTWKYLPANESNESGLYFDGVDDYIIINESENISIVNNFLRIDVVAKIDANSSGVLVSKYDYLNSKFIELGVNYEGTIRFALSDVDNSISIESENSYSDDSYHNITAILSQDIVQIYVDDVLESFADASILSNLSSEVPFSIGANAGYLQWMNQPVQNFKGEIKDVKIYFK